MEKVNVYCKAYVEVIEVLKYIPEEDYNKISQKYISFLEENADENYSFEYNVALPFDKQDISEEAKNILAMIFKLFIVNDEKKSIDKEEKIERDNYYCKNINIDRKAFSEVYMILKEYNEIKKIPEKYLWVIEDNMDKEYIQTIDDIFSIKLMEDTKKIITYIYTNFLSTPEERENLKALEKMQFEQKKSKISIKTNEIFIKDNLNKSEDKLKNNNALVEYKESLFKRIIKKIKNIFKR